MEFFFILEDLLYLVSPNAKPYYFIIKAAMKKVLGDQASFLPPELEDNFYLGLLAPLAPILYVNQSCSDASWTYLYNTFLFNGGMAGEDFIPWGLKSMYRLSSIKRTTLKIGV